VKKAPARAHCEERKKPPDCVRGLVWDYRGGHQQGLSLAGGARGRAPPAIKLTSNSA
jgi:hypothetical protein